HAIIGHRGQDLRRVMDLVEFPQQRNSMTEIMMRPIAELISHEHSQCGDSRLNAGGNLTAGAGPKTCVRTAVVYSMKCPAEIAAKPNKRPQPNRLKRKKPKSARNEACRYNHFGNSARRISFRETSRLPAWRRKRRTVTAIKSALASEAREKLEPSE